MKVLILYDYFDPAYKAGGPIRSLVNLVNLIEEKLDLYILTSNQDHDGSMLDVEPDTWINYGKSARVQYLSKEKRGFSSIKKVITKLKPDLVYLNGIYSIPFVVYPLWIMRNWKDTRIAIAPRGMLQIEALSIKPLKKKIFLKGLKHFCLSKDITWQVTTAQEKHEISGFIPDSSKINLIGNVPNFGREVKFSTAHKKKVFGTVALISPMKNIHLILKALAHIPNELDYELYGPIKDQPYWNECLELIQKLPKHIHVNHLGAITPDKVAGVIAGFDFYIQPSKSENFGHSIFEAFNQGIPVIISDQTPWKDLKKKKAGWDIDLTREGSLQSAMIEAIAMDDPSYSKFQQGARKIAEDYIEANDFLTQYKELFF